MSESALFHGYAVYAGAVPALQVPHAASRACAPDNAMSSGERAIACIQLIAGIPANRNLALGQGAQGTLKGSCDADQTRIHVDLFTVYHTLPDAGALSMLTNPTAKAA